MLPNTLAIVKQINNESYEDMAKRKKSSRKGRKGKLHCWRNYHRVRGKRAGSKGSCAPNYQLKF